MVQIPTPTKPGKKGAKTGALCRICSFPHKLRSEIDQKLIAGDRAIAVYRWAQKTFPAEMAGISDDSFYRHRNQHIKSIVRAARKLSDSARIQREKIDLAKSVLKGDIDPQAYFSPAEIARDVKKTSDRLDDAADDAHKTRQHSALASLSGALVRTHELRAKMGGSIQDKTEITVSVALSDVHQRLDALIGAPTDNRQTTARGLLGLLPPSDPLPGRRRPIKDLDQLSNPGGDSPLTIDAIPLSEAPEYQPDAESRSLSPAGGKTGHSGDDLTGNSWGDEPLGTRYR